MRFDCKNNFRRLVQTPLVVAWVAALCMLSLFAEPAVALAEMQGEYELKAAFLFNFMKFVEWPAQQAPKNGSPYVVGLAGKSSFADTMVGVFKGKTIGSHSIDVRILGEKAGSEVLRECHVIFLFGADAESAGQKLASIRGASVLTVGEFQGFPEAGGVIGFKVVDDSLRFDINNSAAKNAGLTISSKLLKLAKSVIMTKPAGK
jgi:hypothetical protein